MTITEAQMRTRFPQTFPASFDEDILTAAIAAAELQIDRTILGNLGDEASLHLAAHIALRDRRGGAEGVASATAGPLSVTYRQDTQADTGGFYAEYKRIVRSCQFGVTISGFIG